MSIKARKRYNATKNSMKKNLKKYLTPAIKYSHNGTIQSGKTKKYIIKEGIWMVKKRTNNDDGKGRTAMKIEKIKAKKKKPEEITFSSRAIYTEKRVTGKLNDLILYLKLKKEQESKYSTGKVSFP